MRRKFLRDKERLEDLLVQSGNRDYEKDTATEIIINSQANERLADPLVYETLERAMGYHKKYHAILCESKQDNDPESLNKDVVPILGNTIQIIFEYLNGHIEQEEFIHFSTLLKSKGDQFMSKNLDHWKYGLDVAFYTPSSYTNRENPDHFPMRVLTDWRKAFERYDFLMKFKKSKMDKFK